MKKIKFVLLLATLVLFFSCVFILSASGADGMEAYGVTDGQVFTIVNYNSYKSLDVSGGSTAENSDVAQYTVTADCYWQEWRIRYVGNGDYTIQDMHSRKLITNVSNDARIRSDNGSDAQKFKIQYNSEDDTYTFLSKSSGYTRALGTYNSGTANGDTVRLLTVDSSDNQKYTLSEKLPYGVTVNRIYSLVNLSNRKAIDVPGGSKTPNTIVSGYTFSSNNPWQRFKLKYAGDGDFYLIDQNSGYYLTVTNSSASANALVRINSNLDSDSQRFQVQRNTDDSYSLYTKCSGYKMTLGWSSSGNLVQLNESTSSNQKFRFIISGHVYSIVNQNSWNSLDVSNGYTANGSDVAQYQRVDGCLWQEWKLNYLPNENVYTILDMHSGKYLSIEGSSSSANANAWIWAWDGTAGQKFKIKENTDGTVIFYTMAGASNNMVLTLPYHANNTSTLVQQAYTGLNNQRFYLDFVKESEMPEGYYYIESEETGLYMQRDDNGNLFVEQHNLSGNEYQFWEVKYDADGYYRIISISNDLLLTNQDNISSGKRIELSAPLGDDPYNNVYNTHRQRWKFTVKEYGSYEFQSRYHINESSSLVVAVGSGSGSGVNIEQINRSDTTKDKWVFARTTVTPTLKQEHSEGCWIACAEMITETYGYNFYSQSSIASKFTYQYYDGCLENTELACEYFTETNVAAIPSKQFVSYRAVYSEQMIRRFIDNGDPIIMLKGAYEDGVRDGGHGVVIVGYYYDHPTQMYRYIINDPSSAITSTVGTIYDSSYEHLLYGQIVHGADEEDPYIWEGVVTADNSFDQNVSVNQYCPQ